MSELIFRRGGEDLMRVSLDRPSTSVGRGAHNDVALPDEQVSRSQFSIVQRGSRTVLLDASGRGTRVGGVDSQEVELCDGTEIDLGTWSALFREAGTVAEAVTDPRAGHATGETLSEHRQPEILGEVKVIAERRGAPEQSLSWARGEVTIGSARENRLVLADRYVSSWHLMLTRSARGIWLRDRGSTNGTFLRGTRVQEAEVPLGAVLRLGETEVRVEFPGAPRRAARFGGVVGKDPALLEVLSNVERVAGTNLPVTIFGETGTGKELIARSVHDRSPRHDRPFVAINCAALHRELIESALFGHEKGAFTGADRARAGAFEAASGGTLFLDEIGELPLDLQAKLLRVLETGEVQRLGGSTPIRCEVRVVSATHVDLVPEVTRKRFREDLFYRLCVFPLHLPPLRARPGDLQTLADHFVAEMEAGSPAHLTAGAQKKLASHPFKGNVRELRNVIARALCLRTGGAILAEHIVFDTSYRAAGAHRDPRQDDEEYLYLPDRTLHDLEGEIVERAVRRNIDKTATAQELGISRTTVTNICQRHARNAARP